MRWLIWWPPLWAGVTLVTLATGRWWWALSAFLLAVFTNVARTAERVPQYGLEHALTVESEAFRDSLAGLAGTPFLGGNTVTILNNGKAFYPAMLDAIANARHSITMEAYIYWDGDVGRQFAGALAERARSGVSVKLLLDAVGSTPIGAEILAELERGPCQLAWFNPLRWWSLDKVNNRTHRKSLIVDGEIAFTGGAGIADHWMGDAEDDLHWRDLMVRVQGPAAVPLQTGFAQNWLETTCEVVSGPRFFPSVPAGGTLDVQTVLSSPGTGASVARLTYFLALASARSSVLIANPYFVPDRVALDLIASARARRVSVDIIVAGRRNDNWLARRNSVRLYGRL
ncbi:MAG: phosphatidylserine/phosphatidylglycerophosphate/cardiolipin synthase family protein, partial [Vicinamibacterales bacterium]